MTRLQVGIVGGIVITAAGLIAPSVSPPIGPAAQAVLVRLTGGDHADAGSGLALVLGPSGIPIPPDHYAQTMAELYGIPTNYQIVPTPEGWFPITGNKSLMLDPSTAEGVKALEIAIQNNLGNATAENPLVVSGYSQSSMISTQIMQQLHDGVAGVNDGHPVASDLLRFVLVGDPNNPNGGALSRFDVPINGQSPTVPALGMTFNGATPSDLYPTDIYTNEYDAVGDFPRYPINLLSDINAYLGILYDHATYAVNTPADVADAVLLPGSKDYTGPLPDGVTASTETDYYMIHEQYLPLLQWMLAIPGIGKPLYDLLEPDMRILVNLGYGNIENGWDPGPANVPTPFGLFPTDSADFQWSNVLPALGAGLQKGLNDFINDLEHPTPYPGLLDSPAIAPLVAAAYQMGLTDTPHPTLMQLLEGALQNFANFPISDASLFSSSPTELINDFTATLSADYSTLLPIADTVNTLLTTVPSDLISYVIQELSQGNILEAIGQPIAAATGLVPLLAVLDIGAPLVYALGGTLVNLVNLFGLGDLVNSIGGESSSAAALSGIDSASLAPDPTSVFDPADWAAGFGL